MTPSLEWFDITRGVDGAGELLAAFEMLELGSDDLPRLTEPKIIPVELKSGKKNRLIATLSGQLHALSFCFYRSFYIYTTSIQVFYTTSST